VPVSHCFAGQALNQTLDPYRGIERQLGLGDLAAFTPSPAGVA
jgi:hypothetical protein